MVRKRAKFRAHIESITWGWNAYCITDYSATVGYGIAEEKNDYDDILVWGMTEDKFNRLVELRYWELHKQEYYNKYKKSEIR